MYRDKEVGINVTDLLHYWSLNTVLNDIGSPILFLEEFKKIPNLIVSHVIGLSPAEVYYEDKEAYSVNKIFRNAFGMNVFQVVGILGLAFLASIVLVSILLPNLYFKFFLYTDKAIVNKRAIVQMRTTGDVWKSVMLHDGKNR